MLTDKNACTNKSVFIYFLVLRHLAEKISSPKRASPAIFILFRCSLYLLF